VLPVRLVGLHRDRPGLQKAQGSALECGEPFRPKTLEALHQPFHPGADHPAQDRIGYHSPGKETVL
jgi:hypothetical protein